MTDSELFEIYKDKQNGLNVGKNTQKSGEKKNFHFGNFGVKKWKTTPFCVSKIDKKKDSFRLKPQIGEKKIGNKR